MVNDWITLYIFLCPFLPWGFCPSTLSQAQLALLSLECKWLMTFDYSFKAWWPGLVRGGMFTRGFFFATKIAYFNNVPCFSGTNKDDFFFIAPTVSSREVLFFISPCLGSRLQCGSQSAKILERGMPALKEIGRDPEKDGLLQCWGFKVPLTANKIFSLISSLYLSKTLCPGATSQWEYIVLQRTRAGGG